VKKTNVLLWIVQVLLAALFLFSGVMKFVMPVEAMTKGTSLPGWFFHFIGVCEILGALGLILPGITGIGRVLTPIAAGGLVIIMIGATAISAAGGQVSVALIPAVVGLLAAFVVYGRRRPTAA
jgi:uncharacterized membrane protein YphA (DoxX/SURF4 family)